MEVAHTVEEVSGRLQAALNGLLLRRLFQGEPRPLRVFRVAIEGTKVTLTLYDVPSAIEEKLRRTPQGSAAIAAWEHDLLIELGPMIWQVVEECTGSRVTQGFEIVRDSEGHPALLFTLEPEDATTEIRRWSHG